MGKRGRRRREEKWSGWGCSGLGMMDGWTLLDPTGTRNLADTKTRTADASLHGGDGIETGQAASNYFANSSSRGV